MAKVVTLTLSITRVFTDEELKEIGEDIKNVDTEALKSLAGQIFDRRLKDDGIEAGDDYFITLREV